MTTERTSRRSHSVSSVFVFLLLAMFLAFSTLLVVMGAGVYRSMTDRSAGHSDTRVLTAYIRASVRAEDSRGAFALKNIQGTDVLCFESTYDGVTYVKQLYVADGALRERFTEAQYAEEALDGDTICAAQAMTAQLDGKLLSVQITDEEGAETEIRIALRSGETNN